MMKAKLLILAFSTQRSAFSLKEFPAQIAPSRVTARIEKRVFTRDAMIKSPSKGGTMGQRDPRVDAYIQGSPDFAKPILQHLRRLVHEACPNVQETIKWSHPHFDHKGVMCGMAAFKAHCAFGFWKGSLIASTKAEAMGQFGRIASVEDLPKDKVIIGYVKEAVRLNESGVKNPPRPKRSAPPLRVPAELKVALKKVPAALANFAEFSPSHQREYAEWITEAKTKETREKRLATAVAWIKEGKRRNWKYMKSS